MSELQQPPPGRIDVVFISPGGVVTRRVGDRMMRVRGPELLLGTGRDDDLLSEVGRGQRDRVPWESREARRSALERIAAGDVCGASGLSDDARRDLLEHVASTPFLAVEGD